MGHSRSFPHSSFVGLRVCWTSGQTPGNSFSTVPEETGRDPATEGNAERFSASPKPGWSVRGRSVSPSPRPGAFAGRHGRLDLDVDCDWSAAPPCGGQCSLSSRACDYLQNRSRLIHHMEQPSNVPSEITQATLLLCGPLVAAKVKDVSPLSLGEFN